ncbi:MAG: hypothetical protein HND44_11180 [Chloroflexi bacterium]|nr:hypothetical protein [Ardenticatenaceae bacterium]MBL1129041.1 hypothetical protein [Chloroflexota bacterium]NOG35120.1 hypothetical protein [Chloroflexota bacterium]GIK58229.1 MAG: hypothetical protein BroJett015_38920 [Chloroflexota bacterium]
MSTPAVAHSRSPTIPQALPPHLTPLETAVWRAIAYADVFDYPLTAVEVHRYLVEAAATLPEVEASLDHLAETHLCQANTYYTLPGRQNTVAIRQERGEHARQLWPVALKYGRLLSSLPFTRMVAVTGSLAVDNVALNGDIDYLLVVANGRVWLNRAFAILIVRLAARHGHTLCPNYILAENALFFSEHNLYTAHEVAQMVPLSGLPVYQQMRQMNSWTAAFLPNANGAPHVMGDGRALHPHLQALAELPLRTPLGQWLDRWEMQRKIRKFQPQAAGSDAAFSRNWCKGHFDTHKQYALTAYQTRLEERPRP